MDRADPPQRMRMHVPGIEDRARPDEHVAEDGVDEPHDDDVADLPACPEPLRCRKRLEHRRPHQAPAAEHQEVLERVNAAVMQCRLVEHGQMPEVEVHGPDRQRHERMGEEAEPVDRLQREHGPEHGPGQAGDEAERRQVAEDHVLAHVDEEEVLLAELVHRGVERDHDEGDPEPEQELPARRHRPAAARERARPAQVEHRHEQRRHDLQRLEVPGGGGRGEHLLKCGAVDSGRGG